MTFVPVSAANAASGDLAHGVVLADANKNNTADLAGLAGEADHGLAGVTVNALDEDGNMVANTITAVDGSWSILESDVDGGPAVSIEIVTDEVNGDVYAAHGATSGDNAFARAVDPNRATADLAGGTDVELNALVYPVWEMDLALAGDPNGWQGLAVRTGSDPFDADDSQPGLDSGMDNDRVRSSDIVSYNWSLTTASDDGSLGDAYSGAVFEQTIRLGAGAKANFAGFPAICESGSITAQPSGVEIAAQDELPDGTTEVVLTCGLGNLGEDRAALIFPTLVQPHATSINGSEFTTSARVYAVDENGAATARPTDSVENGPIEITAAPRYDIEKNPGSVTTNNAFMEIDGETVPGIFAYYAIQVSTDRRAGVEAFTQPITIEESFWGTRSVEGPNGEPVGSPIDDLEWYLDYCAPTNADSGAGVPRPTSVYGKIGMNGNATEANSVRDSGSCAIGGRTGDAKTSSYELTFSDIDLSGTSYPTETAGGQPLSAGPFYVASYRVRVFIPMAEVDRMQGEAADGVGELSAFNRVTGFDPVGASGAENYGGDDEPGYCEAGHPGTDGVANCGTMEDGGRSNNVAGPLTIRIASGSWSKAFRDIGAAWTYSAHHLPELSGWHTGDGIVQPGQTFSSMQILRNTGLDMEGAQMCDVFDNTMLKLVPLENDAVSEAESWDAGQYSAVIVERRGTILPVDEQRDYQSNWTIRYGSVDLGGDDPNNGTLDPATDRYEGDWTNQRAAATQGAACADAGATWYDSPEDHPDGADAINVVWASTVDGHAVPSGDELRWYLAFEQRDTYSGGPHDGEQIPAGTVAANFGAVQTSTMNQNWNSNSYIPGAGITEPLPSDQDRHTGENGSTAGDRWTVSRALMSLQKRTVDVEIDGVASSGASDFGVTGAAVAGRPVVWEVVTDLRATSDEPAPVNNVVITDTLPAHVTYNEAATQALAAEEGFPLPTTATPNGDGTTTLTWDLGTRVPNEALPVLRIVTDTDPLAPNNTVLVNEAEITATGIVPVSTHVDDHTVRLEQTGELQLKKSVDKTLDLQDDDQQYLLELKNFSDTLAIQNPTIIEVLPYNGDATNDANVNRSPASEFDGSNRLNAAPEAFEFDGTTPRAGTFYYTTDDPATVSQHLSDDDSAWTDTFTPDATAFKFVADTPLATAGDVSGSGIKITFQTDQAENAAGDLYTDRFTAFSDTLKNGERFQLLTSNTVSVRVVGFSVGDLIWFDLDGDGVFTEGTDRTAPEGVTVEVYDGDDVKVGDTTTDDEGRWLVNRLPRGDYYAVIPVAEFAEGGLLAGAVAAPGPVLDPNTDANEGEDHHAIAEDGGVRSSGLLTLDADTDTDPIQGLEPSGDNVKGLDVPPLTGDDFTNLTLDLALTPPAKLMVEKIVDGEAAQYGTSTFTIHVECTFNGSTAPGYPKTVTLKAGESEELMAPLGSDCTATETGAGGATSVAIDPKDGLTLDSENGEFTFTVTNTFDAGEFSIRKEVAGVGSDLETTGREFVFDVTCSFNGEHGVFETTVTLSDDGSGVLTSDPITGLPVGAECTITETGSGGADETPAPVKLVIEKDPQTAQIAGFVNEFSAGTVEALKELDGDAKDDEFLTGISYEVQLTCAIERDGDRLTLYSSTHWLTPGTAVVPEVGGEPVRFPVGTHCWMEETEAQGADDTTVNFGSYDDAAQVTAGSPDELQTLTLTATNTFDQAELVVSKKVVGPGTGNAYDFELACTYPVVGEDGVEETVEYPLAAGDAAFSLKDGENKRITVLAGVSCAVVETNVPDGATVTVEDSDDSTPGAAEDGELDALTGNENTVEVTNTFDEPDEPEIPVTGAVLPLGLLWTALGLLATGAALLLRRRRALQHGHHEAM